MNSVASVKVTAEEIKEFGQKYDPQPFHLGRGGGRELVLQGPCGVGLAYGGYRDASAGSVDHGRRRDDRRGAWRRCAGPRPVRPGDTIRTEIEVLGVRHSISRPDYGSVRTRTLAFNQRNQVVLRSTVNFLAPVRPKAS